MTEITDQRTAEDRFCCGTPEGTEHEPFCPEAQDEQVRNLVAQRDRYKRQRDETAAAHRSLIRELSTLLGPQRSREGSTENEAWIAAVGRVLIQRDELLERTRDLRDYCAPGAPDKPLSRLYEAAKRIEEESWTP